MAVIDAHGRVFGRFNLVDTLLALLLAAALPAGYAASRLFREPPPTLVRISPATVSQGEDRLIELTGERMRPYMRVSFGALQGPSFQYYGPTQAFVPAPALDPGTYDVVLYDYMREVARLPKALTVTGPNRPARVAIRIRGAYVGLSKESAARLQPGSPLNATEGVIGTAETLGEPRPSVARVRVSAALTVSVPMEGDIEVPATILLTCPTSIGAGGVMQCATAGAAIAPDMHLTFQGPAGRLLFRIDEIVSAAAEGSKVP